MRPLYYSMLLLFTDHAPHNMQEIIETLKPEYGHFKMLRPKSVEEGLMTAAQNGLLTAADCVLDQNGNLVVDYKVTDYGAEMIRRYIR